MDIGQRENLSAIPQGEYVFPSMDKVLFGPGSSDSLPDEMGRLGLGRALLVTTASVASTPILPRMRSLLGDCLVAVFDRVQQHTPARSVTTLVDDAKRLKIDAMISVGGGSVIDTTKAGALALARDTGAFLHHIALPTTLSAAEFSPFFGVTDEETRVKVSSTNPFVTPRLVILDVSLADHTPDWLWFASGIRSLDHAVETVYAPNHQPATDATSLESIRLLFRHLPGSNRATNNINARQHCQVAAWLSFFGVANITLGLSHMLGRELGPRYNVPHGYTSCVLLPKVMSYLLPSTSDRQALIAGAAGARTRGQAESEVALEASVAVFELIRRLGLPQRLRDLGVPESDLPDLARGRHDVLDILQSAW